MVGQTHTVLNAHPEDIQYLLPLWVEVIDNVYRVKCLPASEFLSVPREHLLLFMALTARYVLPTQELIAFLGDQIAGRSALEIGSGNADIYYHLRIRGTDSYIQQSLEVKMYYEHLAKQTPTNPPYDVECLTGEEAVSKYRPQVVIGCYITRKYIEGKDGVGSQASVYGVKEENILASPSVQTYVHVGNDNTHGTKHICKRPHEVIRLPGLVTRAAEPDKNAIYIWRNARGHA